ncbi:MAG TPA: GNAT family N-acetyltransferase [Actinomycetota bacterium]|nr:GNAT family N-acetyltransferase [Actinomycetota bacterium]
MTPEIEYSAVLDDGTNVGFRRVSPDDKERLQKGLAQLSPKSRYLRFFGHVDHFTADQLRYLTEVDFRDHFAWMAVLPDAPGAPGVGIGRWVRLRDEPAEAEAAVTVVDEYQGRGIGTALLWLLARSAIERGVEAFRVAVLGENRTMLDLLGAVGARRGRWESGVVEFVVPLRGHDPVSEPPARLVLKAVAAAQGTDSGA